MIFESTEATIVAAVERALKKAKVPFEIIFARPTLDEIGPRKLPKRFFVHPSVEGVARLLTEQAVTRRGRVVSLQPKPQRTQDLTDGGGSIDIIDFGSFDGGHGGH